MYAVLRSSITIGGKSLSRVNGVSIKRSIRTLGDTCFVKTPSSAVIVRDGEIISEQLTAMEIRVGDEIIVNVWYNDNRSNKDFHGFVKNISYKKPLEIECEDYLYLLRQEKICKRYKKTTLKKLLADLIAGVNKISLSKDCDDIDIEGLSLCGKNGEAITRAAALQIVKDRYGIACYFNTTGELYAGILYKQNIGTVKYKMGYNVVRERSNIRFRKAEDIKVQVKVINIDSTGTRTEAIVGDSSGAERTVYLYDVKDKSQLEKLAMNELNKYKLDGWEGKLVTKLEPQAEPAMVASLSDSRYPDTSGDYVIESVQTDFDTNGAWRTVEIGPELSQITK
jgi:hypothetical protein